MCLQKLVRDDNTRAGRSQGLALQLNCFENVGASPKGIHCMADLERNPYHVLARCTVTQGMHADISQAERPALSLHSGIPATGLSSALFTVVTLCGAGIGCCW